MTNDVSILIQQRRCAFGKASGISGQCVVCRKNSLRKSFNTQSYSPIKVGSANYGYEQEADRVADYVMQAGSSNKIEVNKSRLIKYIIEGEVE